ncbi:MAG: CoA transferase [Burkholderiales bacterium]|nr:CoA transferase [Burkholderiales bacterium]
MSGALAGIRVLDLSRILAGPMATQTLADLGAEVIKIERPGRGDDTRAWGPPFVTDAQGRPGTDSAYFVCCNRGKQSVTVDLSHPEGQAIVRALARQCDVLVENYKVGDLARFGLAYEDLRALDPRLVYCSITGFGQTGPYSERPGYDPVAQALGGMMSITGTSEGPPQRVGVAVVDVLTSTWSVIAILAALRHRDISGEGQYIDMSLLDVQVSTLVNVAQNYLSAGLVSERNGGEHPNVMPSQSFACADGRVMLAAANDLQFTRLCQTLGIEAVAADARFATNSARVHNRAELAHLLEQRLLTGNMVEWESRLNAAGVPCGRINDIAQVFADPQVRHRGMRIGMEHPVAGVLPLVGNPIDLSATPVEYRCAPPLLGQHTEEVLGRLLDLTPQRIEALRAAGAI